MVSSKKKIAVFGVKGFPAIGGASSTNENIVNQLKDKFDYTIYSVSTHTDKAGIYNGYRQIVFRGVKGKRLNTLLYYIKSLLHTLFVGNYDIIQVNHLASGFLIPFLRLKYKVVATAHGIIPPDDNKWNRVDKTFFELSSYLFFKFSTVAISVSKPHIQAFKKYTSKDVLYIPNGILANPIIKNEPVTQLPYILFAANRIISLKGCHIFLQALNKLEYKGKVIIIGDTSHTPNYYEELKINSKQLNVEFLGLIRDKNLLFNYVQNATFFVFPSLNEGMSNMLLEVASIKTPLICSDIPENKVVFNENEVLFFKSGDADNLAVKIEYALNNSTEIKKNATNAYLKIEQEYSWDKIALEYEKIYNSF